MLNYNISVDDSTRVVRNIYILFAFFLSRIINNKKDATW